MGRKVVYEKKLLKEYFSEDNWLCALKNREELTFDTLLTELKAGNWTVENRDGIIKKIEGAKTLWKSISWIED